MKLLDKAASFKGAVVRYFMPNLFRMDIDAEVYHKSNKLMVNPYSVEVTMMKLGIQCRYETLFDSDTEIFCSEPERIYNKPGYRYKSVIHIKDAYMISGYGYGDTCPVKDIYNVRRINIYDNDGQDIGVSRIKFYDRRNSVYVFFI